MKKILILMIILLIAIPALASSTFRCGKRLVHIGDSKAMVLITCGEPFDKTISYQTEGNYQKNWYSSRGTYSQTTKRIEKFYYKSKGVALLHILTFIDGVLKKIKTGKRIIK